MTMTKLDDLLRAVSAYEGEALYGRAEREFSNLMLAKGFELDGAASRPA